MRKQIRLSANQHSHQSYDSIGFQKYQKFLTTPSRSFYEGVHRSKNNSSYEGNKNCEDRALPQTTPSITSQQQKIGNSLHDLYSGEQIESIRSQISSDKGQKNIVIPISIKSTKSRNVPLTKKAQQKILKKHYDDLVKKYNELRKINCSLELQNNCLKAQIAEIKKQQNVKQINRVPNFIRVRQIQRKKGKYINLFYQSERVSLDKKKMQRF